MKLRIYLVTGLLFIVFISNCQSRKVGLISKTTLEYSDLPSYGRFVDQFDDKDVFKEQFQHLEELELSKLWYYSDGLKINGFVIQPKGKGKYPVVVFNRGGNKGFGSFKAIHIIYFLSQLASEGYVVVASNYRGDGISEGKDEFGGKDVNDVINLIEILPEIEGADTSKIGMYGWSRGGMMTYISLTKTDKVKAAIVGGGVSDHFETIKDRPGMESVMQELIPDYEKNKTVELEKRSAVHFADQFSKEVPILIVHGNADWRVKASQAYKMAMKLDELRIPYRLKVYEGGDHGLKEFKADLNREVIEWFDRFLKSNEELPNMEYHGK
jgi:dipeptidyl aminopeptidase/acylaminoacyl peptidase